MMRKGRGSIFKYLGSRWICWTRPTRGRTTTWGGAGPKQWAAKWEPEGLKIPRWETDQGNLLHLPWPSGLHPSAVFFPTSEAARRREATSRRWCAGFGMFRWLDAIDIKNCLDAMCWCSWLLPIEPIEVRREAKRLLTFSAKNSRLTTCRHVSYVGLPEVRQYRRPDDPVIKENTKAQKCSSKSER